MSERINSYKFFSDFHTVAGMHPPPQITVISLKVKLKTLGAIFL